MRALHSAERINSAYSGRKSRHLGLRFVSLLLCLCMILPLLPGFGGLVVSSASGGPTAKEYALSRVADANTMDDYVNRLLNSDNGSRYAGRVWTDKTVVAYDAGKEKNSVLLDMKTDGFGGNVTFDADFLHVFSALASSQVVNEASPMDVMFVIDVSGSMGQLPDSTASSGRKVATKEEFDDTPIKKLVDAVNKTITDLLTLSPNSRFGIAIYGSTAAVLVPLGHYEIDIDSKYLETEYIGAYGSTQGLHYSLTATVDDATGSGHHVYYADNAGMTSNEAHNGSGDGNRLLKGTGGITTGDGSQKEDSGDKTKGPFHVGHITNPQAGFAAAMDQFITDNDEITWEASDGRKCERIPTLIHLTDGQASDIAWIQPSDNPTATDEWDKTLSNWNNVNWKYDLAYNSENNSSGSNRYNASQLTGSGDAAPVIFQTLMTAAYYKSAVDAYYESSGAKDLNESFTPLSCFSVYASDTSQYEDLTDNQVKATIDAILNPEVSFKDSDGSIHDSSGYNKDTNSQEQFIDTAYELYKMWLDKGVENVKFETNTTSSVGPNNDITITLNVKKGDKGKYAGESWGNKITDDVIKENINYVPTGSFYHTGFDELEGVFGNIIDALLGKVFMPMSGNNDADVGDSITYQDPIGDYMELKNGAISTTPLHADGTLAGATEATYDMAVLLFGEMHGLVRAGVYDWQWNDDYLSAHPTEGTHGVTAFPEGWYLGDAANPTKGGNGSVPSGSGIKSYADATAARADGWVFRVNYKTAMQFVPTLSTLSKDGTLPPDDLPDQMKNTVYTLYRFSCNDTEGNELRRNPIFGAVPDDIKTAWENAKDPTTGAYPATDEIYSKTPGVYRLNDIRVWIEDTGDFVDESGKITPNAGYDRSLYVNIPAAAVPTQLATITIKNGDVLSYQTNLATDKGLAESSDDFKTYSYQSTPFRLFYAVGLEEAVIYRDDEGNQTGVNFNAISAEYIEQHTIEGQDYVWFISNYYSNTTYDDYVTDTTASRTRGDPTVTFSPSEDNRYYVFQKPLPLYAHAYRASTDGGLKAVDNTGGSKWVSESNSLGGNGKTTWENNAVGGGAWTGGEFMGVYNDEDAFKAAVARVGDTGMITDSHGSTYKYAADGIVFLEDDLLDHVKTKEDGSGFTSDSVSFSSDDYFFILVEYYLPGEGEGTDFEGNTVKNSHDGRKVQYVLARKGSEFGSGFVSDQIDNGDMLCWTDMNGHITQQLNYLSKSDTGDYTRGEPTWEKLTKKDNDLKEYLRDTCHISDVTPEGATKSPLDEAFEYWTGIQADEVVQAALTAAKNGDSELTQEEFNTYFQFAVATRPGGIRTGDMANNIQTKGEYNAETGTFSNNLTNTSNSYYLPTVSPNSGTDDKIIINNYLGNNGYLEIANQMLHVTKMLEPPEGFTLSESELNEIFNYQIFVQGVVGERSAINTLYNEYAGVWERRLAYIDVVTDNSNLVLDNSNNRAMFVRGTDGTAEHVVPVTEGDGTSYYYADENGDTTDKKYEGGDVFYLYLPADAEGSRTRRIYQDSAYSGDDKVDTGKLSKNGRTTFFKEGQRDETGTDPGADNRDSFRKETTDRPAGTRSYWVMDAELIPVNTVNQFEAEAEENTRWSHTTTNNDNVLQYFTFVIRKPNDETSGTYFSSPFKTRTLYMTTTLYFGTNANTKDGSKDVKGAMAAADLYDGVVPSGDRPDLFGPALTNEQIAKNTAEFTLKHGEGLLLTGLNNRIAYRFTEKLTDDQIAKGYALKQVSHIQQRGSQSTFLPGVQKIPIYTQDGATYGSNYATGYQNKQTENGLTWSDNPNATVKYEPFAHTNATLWECYATMGSGVSGNHHQPEGAPAEKESTQYYWNGTDPNTYTEVKQERNVVNNPNCATCDEEQSDGSILHYMYKDGELVDPHYNGEATSMLRNMARYIVSPTVRFGVVGEGTTQPTTTATLPEHDYYNYSGVYSVFGNTGWFEEQVNYVNTVDPELLVITKEMVDKDGHEVVPAPNEEFEFTLTLTESATAAIKDGPLYYWKGNSDLISGGKDGMPEKAPHLYEYEEYISGDKKLAKLEPETDGTYKITLKGHEAVVIYGIPIKTGYSVTETVKGDYPCVGENKKVDEKGAADYDDDPTKSGTIVHNTDETVAMKPTATSNREDYYNLMPPGTLIVKKKIVDDDAETVNREFEFTVTLTPRTGGTLDKSALTAVKYDKDGEEETGFKLEWEDVKDASGNVTGLTATFTLRHRESVKIDGMPIGTTYNVAETGRPGYNLQHVADNDKDDPDGDGKYVTQEEDGSVSGEITSTDTDIYLLFANGKAARVPFTGSDGLGADAYLIGGMLLIGLALVPMLYSLGKRRSYRR